MKRRVLLVELDMPEGRWSARELEEKLQADLGRPDLEVYGEIDTGCIKATRQKLNQLNTEIEAGRSYADLIHSGHKAMSFFRDVFPDRFWRRHA